MYRSATLSDLDAIQTLFWKVIKANPAYISHGELQMGIADDIGVFSEDGPRKWTEYITGKIGASCSHVYVCESEGALCGFIVTEVVSDNDKPFGMVCDLVVDEQMRGQGVGKALLGKGLDWLRGQGVEHFYLESGVNNHNAHEFFENQGFRMVSHIFRL